MSVTPLQFERALLEVLKTVFAEACHVDIAIGSYLSGRGIDEDDPGLWSDLRCACNKLLHLIVAEGSYRGDEALKFVVRLGVSRAIRGDVPVDWSLGAPPSRVDSAIRTLLLALRQGDPDEGERWWRLYTMSWAQGALLYASTFEYG